MLPITAASAALGVIGFMNALLARDLAAGAAALAAAFFAGAVLAGADFAAAFLAVAMRFSVRGVVGVDGRSMTALHAIVNAERMVMRAGPPEKAVQPIVNP